MLYVLEPREKVNILGIVSLKWQQYHVGNEIFSNKLGHSRKFINDK